MGRPLGDFGRLPAQLLRLVAQHRDLAAGVFGVQGDHLLRVLRARQLLGELAPDESLQLRSLLADPDNLGTARPS